MKPLAFLVSVLLLTFQTPAFAQQPSGTKFSFTIAPPPVAYPEMHKGEALFRLDGTLMSVNTEVIDIVGALPSMTIHKTFSDVAAGNFQMGLGIMAGDKYGLFMMQAPFRFNVQHLALKAGKATVFVFGGSGMDMSVSSMSFNTVAGFDLIKIDILSTSFMFPIRGGAQLNYEVSSFILSPYATITRTYGLIETTTTSNSIYVPADSKSSTIPAFTSIVLGFDALYKPWGISLSTLISSSKDATTAVLSLGKVLGRRS